MGSAIRRSLRGFATTFKGSPVSGFTGIGAALYALKAVSLAGRSVEDERVRQNASLLAERADAVRAGISSRAMAFRLPGEFPVERRTDRRLR